MCGPRSGGKTIDFAVIEFLEAAYKSANSCHLGAVLSQAKRAYKYVSGWANKFQADLNISTITREHTVLGSGAEIEIVPGTVNGVNSPHPHKANIDEFELLAWDIFAEALSMPKSSGGVAAATRLGTTRKYPTGNAQRMIEEAPARGFRVYTWCLFEVLETCHATCANCPFKAYVSTDRDGKRHDWPSVCQGKAHRSAGYYSLKDALKKFMSLEYEIFDAQWLCNRPETCDSVFSEFSRSRNVLPSFSCLSMFDTLLFSPVFLGRGWDFGLDDPTAVSFFAYNCLGRVVKFHECVVSGRLIDDIAKDVREFSDLFAPATAWTDWGDPSGAARLGVSGGSYISRLATHDIFVNYQRKIDVMSGICEMKKRLRPSTYGIPEFYMTENCKKSIAAYEMAKWDRQAGNNAHSREKYRHDEHSHPLDADRYFLTGQFCSANVSLSTT